MDGQHIRIQKEDELIQKLHQRNRVHFAQAHGTPFTIPPLSTKLTFSGVSTFGKKVLNGTTDPPEHQTSADLILAELTQVLQPLSDIMPLQDMIQGLSKWRESTTTSPSGKHLGIYKTLMQYHRHNNKPTANNNNNSKPIHKSAYIALKIQNIIINRAIQHTHTLERWKTVHNFFIERVPGRPLLEKLRVIHIYEADWNLILKYFISHRLAHAVCQHNSITQEQAGGRLGSSASDMATKKVLTHATIGSYHLQ
jgi:hypothetical protein